MARPSEIAKRVFDVVASGAGLLLIWPVLLVFYVAARVSSGGGGFYVQDRVGRGGAVFGMLKFRTMRAGHVHDPDPSIVISPDHEAVTSVGRFLRKYKLDELPQLLHVLSGRMSLVGPRPTVPEQVADYDDFQRRRLEVLPGITGLAQTNGDTALTWDERIAWDVYYVDHRSFGTDLGILLRTFVVLARGAERVARRLEEVHPEAGARPRATGGGEESDEQ